MISAINLYDLSQKKSYSVKSANSSQKVSFGFGEDYVNDDFLEQQNYVHKEGNGSVLGYFRLIGVFIGTVIKEKFMDNDNSYYDLDDDNDDIDYDSSDFYDIEP